MLQTLANLGEFLGGIAVIGGVIFAVIQVRHYKERRQREIAFELLHSFQTPEFWKALQGIFDMPEGLSKKEIDEYFGDNVHLAYALMATWESLGILVFRGVVGLDLVEDFFSGPIAISWKKLQPHVVGKREDLNRETLAEWFEWLGERLKDIELKRPPIPAHIAHKDWRPPPRWEQ
jgi:hypothetical protein